MFGADGNVGHEHDQSEEQANSGRDKPRDDDHAEECHPKSDCAFEGDLAAVELDATRYECADAQ